MNKQGIISLIKNFVGSSNLLVIPTKLIEFTGGLDTALLLSQIIYWSDKTTDGWIAKSYREWFDEIRLSEYEVRSSAKKLEAEGLIMTKLKQFAGAPRIHYKLNEEVFVEKFMKFLGSDMKEQVEEENSEIREQLQKLFLMVANRMLTPFEVAEMEKLAKSYGKEKLFEAIKECAKEGRITLKGVELKLNPELRVTKKKGVLYD